MQYHTILELYATHSSGIPYVEYRTNLSLVFSGVNVYHGSEIKVTSGIFHGDTARKGCITILYHAMENTVARWESCV